jgi:hypothetical protein
MPALGYGGCLEMIYTADGEEYNGDSIRGVVIVNIILTETDQIGFNWDKEIAGRLRGRSHSWRNRFKRGMLKAMEQSLNKQLAPEVL